MKQINKIPYGLIDGTNMCIGLNYMTIYNQDN